MDRRLMDGERDSCIGEGRLVEERGKCEENWERKGTEESVMKIEGGKGREKKVE